MLTNVSKDDFSRALNSEFVTKSATNVFGFELIALEEGRSNPNFESFSLLFRAPVNTASEQQVYAMSHPNLGQLDLLLVPIKRDSDGVIFEAVFNRTIS